MLEWLTDERWVITLSKKIFNNGKQYIFIFCICFMKIYIILKFQMYIQFIARTFIIWEFNERVSIWKYDFLYMLIVSLINTLSEIMTFYWMCCLLRASKSLHTSLIFKSQPSIWKYHLLFTQYLCNSLVIQTCTWKLIRSSCECTQRKTLKKHLISTLSSRARPKGKHKEHSSEYEWELFFIDQ